MNITYIVLVICLAFNLFMFFYFKWYVKKRTSAGLLPEEKMEVSRLVVDINAVTDRNLLLIEDKIKQLKEILDDTDKRISVYVKELEKSRTGEALYTNLGRGIRAALKTEADFELSADQGERQKAPVLSVVRPNIEVKAQIQSTVAAQLELQKSGEKPPSKKQIRASIDLLANEGLPPEEIASRLDISIAEVDLAMNLRRKNK